MSEHPNPVPEKAESLPASTPLTAVPDHELIRLIGKGSYGEVWLARNTLGAFRAVKIVYEKTFRHKRPFDREFNGVRKFEPISRLHDGLMDILHVGRHDAAGYFYCVMELADDAQSGQVIVPEQYVPRTLAADLAKSKRLPIRECRRIGITIATVLQFLHERGLIHRDVKPSNIVFVNGEPKLADIGLVAEMSEAQSYVGTAGFIPPEGPGTAQADIYSLGKVLYEISTGMDRHDYPELPDRLDNPTDEAELPDLNQIFLKACRADPQRYKTAQAMAEDLVALSHDDGAIHRGVNARLFSRAVKVCAGLAIVAAIAWWAFERNTTTARVDGLPPGLVSWWRAENSTRDEWGPNNGTIAGTGQVTYAAGVVGQAFVFDGIHRDRLDLGNPPSLQLQDFTIAAWIKRANPTNISRDDEHEDGGTGGEGGEILTYGTTGYCFALRNDGRLGMGITGIDGVNTTNLVTDTRWHHVAVTTSGSNTVFYLDGLAASEVLSFEKTFYFDTSVAIGSTGSGAGCTFWGMIDELRVFNRALTAAEIRTVYNIDNAAATIRPEGTFVPPQAGLVDWWSAEGDPGGLRGTHPASQINVVHFGVGKAGRGFSFSGPDQCVLIPKTPDLDVGNQVTLACWVKPDRDNQKPLYQGIVTTDFYSIDLSSGYASTNVGVNFFVNTSGKTESTVEAFPDTADANKGGAVITGGQWHHVAGTYDGARLQLYIDGRPWGKPMLHSGPISPLPRGAMLSIGSQDGRTMPTNKGRYFKGLIDEVCIYNRALAVAEIEDIYKAGLAGLTASLNQPSR